MHFFFNLDLNNYARRCEFRGGGGRLGGSVNWRQGNFVWGVSDPRQFTSRGRVLVSHRRGFSPCYKFRSQEAGMCLGEGQRGENCAYQKHIAESLISCPFMPAGLVINALKNQ